MHYNLWNHASQEELVQTHGEAKASPIMSVLENFQAVSIEFNVAIEVHFEECPHWNLVSALVFCLVGLLLEGEVMFDWTSRILDFLILAWC